MQGRVGIKNLSKLLINGWPKILFLYKIFSKEIKWNLGFCIKMIQPQRGNYEMIDKVSTGLNSGTRLSSITND
jgi:hypothetical protein